MKSIDLLCELVTVLYDGLDVLGELVDDLADLLHVRLPVLLIYTMLDDLESKGLRFLR